MVNHVLSTKMAADLDKAFAEWDRNGDGGISRVEFVEGYRRLHLGVNQDVATGRAIEMFDAADLDDNGTLNL